MGACERVWVVKKRIKSGQRAKLTDLNTEKLQITYITHKLNKARIKHEALQELECKDKNELWGEEYEIFDLELEKFGVDIGSINETPNGPELFFCCLIEYW